MFVMFTTNTTVIDTTVTYVIRRIYVVVKMDLSDAQLASSDQTVEELVFFSPSATMTIDNQYR